MKLTELYDYLPFIAVVVGVLLLAWSQKSKFLPWFSKLWPDTKWWLKSNNNMPPAKRFETFYTLRSWCSEAGYISAVMALDDEVLPAIVRIEGPVEVPQGWSQEEEQKK